MTIKRVRVSRNALRISALSVLLFLPLATWGQDVQGSRDHPLLSRMPGYHIRGYEQSEFGSHAFTGKDRTAITVEGKKTEINYSVNDGAKQATPLQIFRNCQSALAKIGGQLLYDLIEQDAFGTTTIRINRDGRDSWVEVRAGNAGETYDVVVVERQVMNQDVVSMDTWRNEIKSTGHAAIYGILFDVDRADIKPESDAALKEIARLLGQDASLTLWVVGHTDASGDVGHNMRLSELRATAVVTALTSRFGIAGARLTAYGVGPLAPVAPNDNEEGRARNRRVELVKR